MDLLVMVTLFAVLLMLFGVLIGAEWQVRVHEQQRRRMAERQASLNAAWRELHEHRDGERRDRRLVLLDREAART